MIIESVWQNFLTLTFNLNKQPCYSLVLDNFSSSALRVINGKSKKTSLTTEATFYYPLNRS